jgi:hypothetical protein
MLQGLPSTTLNYWESFNRRLPVVYLRQAIATQDDYLVTIHNRQRLEHSLNSSHNKIWSFSNAMDHGPK